jgi:hypothetical protein
VFYVSTVNHILGLDDERKVKKVLIDCELIRIACSFVNLNEKDEKRYALLQGEAMREVTDEMFDLE